MPISISLARLIHGDLKSNSGFRRRNSCATSELRGQLPVHPRLAMGFGSVPFPIKNL
jgi:hypothetical protein